MFDFIILEVSLQSILLYGNIKIKEKNFRRKNKAGCAAAAPPALRYMRL
jgi:hypothetical protein